MSISLYLKGKAHFLGQVENPFKFMENADLYVSASEYEGFSNAIGEAMVTGTAVVSTDCPSGPREILVGNKEFGKQLAAGKVEEAEFGALVPVGDTDAMAGAVDELLQNEGKRDHYAQKGMLRAGGFDQARVAAAYLEGASCLVISNSTGS